MDYDRKNLARSSVVGAILAVLFLTVVTVVADLSKPLKDWLAAVFFHHWIGKGILAAIIFFLVTVIGAFIGRFREERLVIALRILFWVTVFGYAALFFFFVYESFWK